MDLNFISSDIALDQVKPLDIKRLIAFVNRFIMKQVQFFNSFVVSSEKKFFNIEKRISKMEVELQLLEAKLDSIPGIQQLNEERVVAGESTSAAVENVEVQAVVAKKTEALVESSTKKLQPEFVPETEEGKDSLKQLRVKDDPRYAKYFKMLKLGVLEAAIKQKMFLDGHDPEILSNPDVLSDAVNLTTNDSDFHCDNEDGDSISSGSDSD